MRLLDALRRRRFSYPEYQCCLFPRHLVLETAFFHFRVRYGFVVVVMGVYVFVVNVVDVVVGGYGMG